MKRVQALTTQVLDAQSTGNTYLARRLEKDLSEAQARLKQTQTAIAASKRKHE
jgi:hypothetical protein